MWSLVLLVFLVRPFEPAALVIENAYAERGTSVHVEPELLRSPSAQPLSGQSVLEVRWDAITRESVIKIATGNSVSLVTTSQKLPPLASKSNSRAGTAKRMKAGSLCTVLRRSGAMFLELNGIALRTAAVGSETRARIPALKDRILRVRVVDEHTAEIL